MASHEATVFASNGRMQSVSKFGEAGAGDFLGCTSAVEISNTDNIQNPAEDNTTSEDAEPVIDIIINNVVCTFNTRCHLNLKRIAMEGMNVIYKRETGMVSMKIRNPRVTASIWSSGKISTTGSNSEDSARLSCRKVARSLQRLGFKVRFTKFRVVNVLGTVSLPFAIRIANFSRRHPDVASYEPELHPGVTYRIKEPRATIKIFSTGSLTVTAPSVENIQSAIVHIYPLVSEFRMEKSPRSVVSDSVPTTSGVIPINKRSRLKRKHAPEESDSERDWSDDDDEGDEV